MKLDAHFAIGNFIRDHLQGGPIRVHGDGTPLRTYMYASDLMIWLWTILFRGQPCRAYNVGSEDAINIFDLARVVGSMPNQEALLNGGSGRGDAPLAVTIAKMASPGTPPPRYVPSTQRAREELALSCVISLLDAIERTMAWNRKRGTQHLSLDAGVMQ
jgi:dTDP-glucose 4,6-dehydratase